MAHHHSVKLTNDWQSFRQKFSQNTCCVRRSIASYWDQWLSFRILSPHFFESPSAAGDGDTACWAPTSAAAVAAVVVGDRPLAVGHEKLARADAARNIRVRPGGAGMDGRRKDCLLGMRSTRIAFMTVDMDLTKKCSLKSKQKISNPTAPYPART